MTREQMLNLIAWFKQQNPEIRVGEYDTLN